MDASRKKGFAIHIVTRKDGNKELYVKCNVITTVGLQRMASHMADDAPGKELFTHMAYGTGVTSAESVENGSLETEIHRKSFDNIFAAGVILFGDVTLLASEIGGDSYVISEVGLYDASAGGNLIARQLMDSSAYMTITGAERIDTLWGIINQ